MEIFTRLESSFHELNLKLRKKIWGRILFRSPVLHVGDLKKNPGEFEFYKLLLSKSALVKKSGYVGPDYVWDVGCRNWSYVHALASVFPSSRLVGVEVDGERRYWNLYRRVDVAEAYTRDCAKNGRQVVYLNDDFMNVDVETLLDEGKSSLFCFFFPFVSERPCVKWGLPSRFANFGVLMQKALQASVHKQSAFSVMSAHQGEWEAEIARAAYNRLHIAFEETVVKPQEFAGMWPSHYDVYLFSSVM
jgi:hypothetical protein